LADCPYSSPADIIKKVCADEGYPSNLVYPFIRFAARVFGGFNLEECSAVEAVKDATIPIQLLHGEDDRFVPCDMSREIHAANPDLVTLETFPGAGHGLSYIVDAARYRCAVLGFEKTLKLL
jgi:pimeloyl-ACP methyl ester carboxylesterase